MVGPPPRRRSQDAGVTRGRSRTRSRSGSPSAGRRSRSSAPACSGCRSPWPSSAARPRASPRSSTSTAPRPARPAHDADALPVSINSHAYVAETSEQAGDEFFPAYAAMMTRIGRERGWPPMTRHQFDMLRAPRGRARGRRAGRGDREDPPPARALRPRPLPGPDERGHPAPRARPALDRAPRHRGRSAVRAAT